MSSHPSLPARICFAVTFHTPLPPNERTSKELTVGGIEYAAVIKWEVEKQTLYAGIEPILRRQFASVTLTFEVSVHDVGGGAHRHP